MSAASYSRTSRPRTDRVSYGRSSAGRASAASGYRGARYVSSSLAEELSFEEAPSISVVPGAGRRARSEGISAAALSLAKACAVICIVIALIAMARVAITSRRFLRAGDALAADEHRDRPGRGQRAGGVPERAGEPLAHQGPGPRPSAMAAPVPEYSEQITLSPDIVATDGCRQPVAVGVGGAP